MQVAVPDYLVDDLLPRLRESDPTVELVPIAADGSWFGSLGGVEVLYKFYIGGRFSKVWGPKELPRILEAAPNLKWIHSGKAGVEDFIIPELVESTIILTNGAGAPKRAVSETVMAFILADAKALLQHDRYQQRREWKNLPHRELAGLTVAILGLGKIGLEVARLCKAFDLRVVGTKRTVSGEAVPWVDQLFLSTQQDECVGQADYVVVTAALTPDTVGMVSAQTFVAMGPDAILINVARGAIVDEDALIQALKGGQIRGAYLDVFLTEPLPAESPLWGLPNTVIMPHNSPMSQNVLRHMTGIFIDNFRRFCRGESLINVVDKRAGY